MTNTTFSTSINFVNLDEDGILVCDNAIVSLSTSEVLQEQNQKLQLFQPLRY